LCISIIVNLFLTFCLFWLVMALELV
jgi:hypothetical protein